MTYRFEKQALARPMKFICKASACFRYGEAFCRIQKTNSYSPAVVAAKNDSKSIKEFALLPSSTIEYKARVLSTNFTIPIIRFNPLKDATVDSPKLRNVSFFNSIGAGVGVYWGRLTQTTDENLDIN